MGISLFLGGSKRLPGWFGALIYCHNNDFACFLKLVPECLARPGPRVPGWVRGGGVQSLFGQCPNAEYMNVNGYSLTQENGMLTMSSEGRERRIDEERQVGMKMRIKPLRSCFNVRMSLICAGGMWQPCAGERVHTRHPPHGKTPDIATKIWGDKETKILPQKNIKGIDIKFGCGIDPTILYL